MTDPDLPQPGWYPDPSGAPALRWWNGVTWSDVTHPLSPDAAPADADPVSVPPTAPLPTTMVWAPVVPPAAQTETVEDAPRRRWWIPVVAVVALLALVGAAASVLLGGFGGGRLDTRALEIRIGNELSQQSGTRVTVDCPSDVPLQQGASFTCTASDPQGDQLVIVVDQTSDGGDVVWTPQR